MKFVLASCCLLSIVYQGHAACWTVPRSVSDDNDVYSPCFYGGEMIIRGSTMTRNCQKCYCDAVGYLRCCSVGTKLTQIPNGCKKVVSPDGCFEHAVKLSDDTSPCPYGVSMVGR